MRTTAFIDLACRLAAAALVALMVVTASAAQTTLPPPLDLATDPLLGTRPVHPNVTFAVSVEFPTVGAAFNRLQYQPAAEQVGYFEPRSCYSYNTAGEYFERVGPATNF